MDECRACPGKSESLQYIIESISNHSESRSIMQRPKTNLKRSMSIETRLTGAKRMVEYFDNAQAEGEETLPSKRVALSICS